MHRATTRFRPCVDQVETRTLLSAGQLAHLAGGSYALIPDVKTDKWIIYIDAINQTRRNLDPGAVVWTVDNGGTILNGSNPNKLDNGKSYRFETPDLSSSSAQMTIKVNGSAIPPFTYSVQRVMPGRMPKYDKVDLK
jgi:hypothetical protein